ncbi:MAG TPA: hypothetical protein PKA00_01795 [Saprospiraceae bacterium]|nr:hypothetical protein [Saprospiraceae bacterium]HMQ81603.1 hypothetical protein [Saprospiraceae bacterium]
MEFIKRFGDKRPEYPKAYRESVVNSFAYVGGRDEEGKYESGKYFSNVYELFMYAALLGLRKDYRLPVEGMDTQEFIKISSWQPTEISNFILMALLAKSNLDLNELEEMEEKKVEAELTGLSKLLEEYANGGFDLIQTRLKQEPSFFDDEFCFLTLLEDD